MSKPIVGAARGAVGAMAMTGFRRVTTGLGLVEATPPERIAHEAVPRLVSRVPPERRNEAIELAHWGFGAAAGALYGALPYRLRVRRWVGPLYGLAIWAGFEFALRRLLGISGPRRKPQERAAVAVDHLLYGAIVGSYPRRG